MKHRLGLLAVLLLLLVGGCSRDFYDQVRLADIRTDCRDGPIFSSISAAAENADGVVMFRQDSDSKRGYLLVTTGGQHRFTAHLKLAGDEYNPRTRELTLRLIRFRPGVDGMLSSQAAEGLIVLRFPRVSFDLLRVVVDARGDADGSDQSIYEFQTAGGGMTSQPTTAVRVNGAEISREEIEEIVYLSRTYGIAQPLADTLRGRIRNELYYQEALNRGLHASRGVAEEFAKEARDALLSAENSAEAQAMLEEQLAHLGMTEEAYWERAVDGYQRMLTIDNLRKSITEQATSHGAFDLLGDELFRTANIYFLQR